MGAALVVIALLAGGCSRTERASMTTTARPAKAAPQPALHVGVVGPLAVGAVRGVRFARSSLQATAPYPLVLVSAQAVPLAALNAVADSHPASHYAYVGASTKEAKRPNVVGIVFRENEAAMLGGFVAGLVAEEQGGGRPRVAWVGPQDRKLAGAFVRGVHDAAPGVTILRAWSRRAPAACKEATLAAIGRSAVAVMAHDGLCADAAVAGANQQNDVGLRITDFELLDVPIGPLVRDAANGVFRGGEDLVFGASNGAIGIRRLDPRISSDVGMRARAAAQQLAEGLRPSG